MKKYMAILPWISSPFRTYDHSCGMEWTEIWNSKPIEIEYAKPMIEYSFHSTPFRLRLSSPYLSTFHKNRIIKQGTTITFKGFDSTNAHHVVEWCHWIDEHEAYLRVVGYGSEGFAYPYWDPDYPSFILVVPVCMIDVPIPLPILHDMPFDNDITIEEDRARKLMCWICH